MNDRRWNGKGYDLINKNIFILKNGNGFMKEYDFEEHIKFEGEYLNGVRNGKGKEYDRGSLIFVGEYLNGERNGKGKEYSYGNVIFEGDFLNGKRNGIGRKYGYFCDYLKYEGEFLNGKINGKGKEYYDNGKIKFEGEYLNGYRLSGKIYDIKTNMYYDLEKINGLFN